MKNMTIQRITWSTGEQLRTLVLSPPPLAKCHGRLQKSLALSSGCIDQVYVHDPPRGCSHSSAYVRWTSLGLSPDASQQ